MMDIIQAQNILDYELGTFGQIRHTLELVEVLDDLHPDAAHIMKGELEQAICIAQKALGIMKAVEDKEEVQKDFEEGIREGLEAPPERFGWEDFEYEDVGVRCRTREEAEKFLDEAAVRLPDEVTEDDAQRLANDWLIFQENTGYKLQMGSLCAVSVNSDDSVTWFDFNMADCCPQYLDPEE